ncbi:MAG: GNAT family N-acetyltransferase [Chloroflexi bacterium]|nr:GNAT family N-acetyltransferase [Chloroflexota bacterium]
MPIIETARLRLRPARADDLDSYQSLIYGDADVMRYLPGGVPRPVERTQATLNVFIQHQAQHGFSVWAVERKDDGEFIGQAGLFTIPNTTEIEVAYAFGKAHWGKGYATEAARTSLRYGFETAALPYILAVANPPNVASQRVMQKIGMRYIGLTSQYYNNTELVLYRMDRDEFQVDDALYKVLEG